MPLDIVLLGIQMPTLLLFFVITGVLHILIDRIMIDTGFYKYVWHLGLFRTAFFVCVFTLVSLTVYE
ncbi:MAG: DUF1656 domain-containing protein [Sulfurimonas sp.]|jgi:hypothetical protein